MAVPLLIMEVQLKTKDHNIGFTIFNLTFSQFCRNVATYLGLPLVPPYLSPLSIGQNALRGVNYASAAAGILDETGRHYVRVKQLKLFHNKDFKTFSSSYI